MKNKDIHKGLDKKEIRDYLGKTLHDLSLISSKPESIEKKIRELEKELEDCRKKQGVLAIMHEFGWQELDISDEIEDYKWDNHIEFIGTEEEYDALVKLIQATRTS